MGKRLEKRARAAGRVKAAPRVRTALVRTQEVPEDRRPKSLALVGGKGIKNSQQFAGLMSALMGDILEGRIAPQVSNAIVNAGSKLLKVVELQIRYGTSTDAGKVLELSQK